MERDQENVPLSERQAIRELVGVTFFTNSLNRLFLLCDRVACPPIQYFRLRSPNEFGDLGWLAERGLLFTPKWMDALSQDGSIDWKSAQIEFGMRLAAIAQDSDASELRALGDIGAVALALQLRESDKLNAWPIASRWQPSPSKIATQIGVMQCVLAALPQPREESTIEEVIEFRTQSIRRGLVQELRLWMDRIVSEERTEGEVAALLESSMQEYADAIYATLGFDEPGSTSEGMGEAIRAVVKLDWRRARRWLLLRRQRRATSLLTNATLPSRHIAHIFRAHQRFG